MASISGSSGPYSAVAYGTVTFHQWTVPANGEYSIVLDTTGLQTSGAPDILVILRNGQNVDGSTAPPRRTYTGNFVAGDVVAFEVFVMAARSNMRASWTITSDALDPSVPSDPVPNGVIEVEGIDMIYFGGAEADALYKGTLLVWEALRGPQADAAIVLDFNDPALILKNTGTTSDVLPVMTGSGAISQDWDHAVFGANGRVFAAPDSPWRDGFTMSMWTRDTPANSGWRTIMHRAMPSGTLTNEAYIVHDTNTATHTYSGLKFGSTHREYQANYSLPVGVDWFHTVVVWERTSTTSFQCRFYINGVSRGIFNATGYASNTQFGSEQLYIGGNRTAGEWSGRMDDLMMWNRALSTEEVFQLYDIGRSYLPKITTTELAGFRLNEFYYFTLAADFPVDSWTATGLPAGITMSEFGTLSGTPTTESTGTMTVTATGSGGLSAQKSFSWSVSSIPPLTVRTITANGSKVSHVGWAKPNLTWSIVAGSGGTFNSDGTLVMFRGKGKVRFTATLNTARSARIVSNLKGVLVTSVSASSSHNLLSAVWVFEEAERIHIEIDNYSGNVNDRLSLASEP